MKTFAQINLFVNYDLQTDHRTVSTTTTTTKIRMWYQIVLSYLKILRFATVHTSAQHK